MTRVLPFDMQECIDLNIGYRRTRALSYQQKINTQDFSLLLSEGTEWRRACTRAKRDNQLIAIIHVPLPVGGYYARLREDSRTVSFRSWERFFPVTHH
jgi:hypothetical protein